MQYAVSHRQTNIRLTQFDDSDNDQHHMQRLMICCLPEGANEKGNHRLSAASTSPLSACLSTSHQLNLCILTIHLIFIQVHYYHKNSLELFITVKFKLISNKQIYLINTAVMESARSSRSSSPADERFIIENWKPEPLVPDIKAEEYQHVLNPHIITSKPGKHITVDGRKCLNCVSHNYLGLADDPRLEEASIGAAKKYGVGSCGPRAFYGTMDVHLALESAIAKFLGVEEVALYSFGFATIASAIPAYAKATDVIYFDERCNFAIQQGVIASKSRAIKFAHNNLEDLERKIGDFNDEREKKYGKPKPIRSFIIVESIYAQTGDMCPLKEIVQIARKYKIRLFIDESRSFGTLGSEGKGITQHLDIDIRDIDLIMCSLENALCGYGGFCAGSTYVVDHQRLAGTGYCFSASLPPLQCQVALESIKILSENSSLVKIAQDKFQYAHHKFESFKVLKNISHALSPIKILVFRKNYNNISDVQYNKEDESRLDSIVKALLDDELIAVTVSRYLIEEEMTRQIASIRVVISNCLSNADIDRIFVALDRFSLNAI